MDVEAVDVVTALEGQAVQVLFERVPLYVPMAQAVHPVWSADTV